MTDETIAERRLYERTEKLITCDGAGGCGRVIGEVVRLGGMRWLLVGNAVVRSMHGTCVCGREIHWSVNDAALGELVKQVLENRQKNML